MTLSAIVTALLFQVTSATAQLDELVRRMDEGAPAPTTVSPAVGQEAAARITSSLDEAALQRYVALARAAHAEEALVPVLLSVVAERGLAAPAAVVALSTLQEHVTRDLPAGALDNIVELARQTDNDEVGVAAAGLVGRWGSPFVVSSALDEWAAAGDDPSVRRLRGLLRGLAGNTAARPSDWVDVLVQREGWEGEWLDALAVLARELAARDAEACAAILGHVRIGTTGPGAVFLRALGAVRLDDEEHFGQARSVLVEYLTASAHDSAAIPAAYVVAAIGAATDLLLPELPPLVPLFVQPGQPPAVRVAATRALVKIGYRDRPTIDLLIPLLADADRTVAGAAHEVLKLKTGQRMAGREALWLRWRDGVELPDEPPGGIAAWLEAQRQARLAPAEDD